MMMSIRRRLLIFPFVTVASAIFFGLWSADAARAATITPQVIQSGPVTITSYMSSTMSELQPGGQSGWQIAVEPREKITGTINMGVDLTSDSTLATGMRLEVQACSVPWVNHTCSTGGAVWMPAVPLASGIEITDVVSHTLQVGSWTADKPIWFVMRLLTDDTLRQDGNATLRVAFWGSGVHAELDGQSTPLAKTGNNLLPGVVIFTVLLTMGLVFMIVSRLFRKFIMGRSAVKAHSNGDAQ